MNDHDTSHAAQQSAEQARDDLELMSREVRDAISKEIPDAEWQLPESRKGGFDTSSCDNSDPSQGRFAVYEADMWNLPASPDPETAKRIRATVLRIAEAHGYTTATQDRKNGDRVMLDLSGPYPDSNFGFAYDDKIVLSGSIGCMRME